MIAQIYDVVVIGAGASGLMAAGVASGLGKNVLIIEKNNRTGKKLLITGKGRCNVTNNCSDIQGLMENIPVNSSFLYSAFSQFMPIDTVELIEDMGVPLKCERGNRVFPVSDKSEDIVYALTHYAVDNSKIMLNTTVSDIIVENGSVSGVVDTNGNQYFCKSLIIATGGKSYPATGSTGDGYRFAENLGHTVTTLKPSLVPFNIHEGFCSNLMGLSLKNISLKIVNSDKNCIVYEDFGEMIFTHFGVSGPLILSASSHLRDINDGKYVIHIDLKPALNEQQLDKRILRDFSENSNKNFYNVLNLLLPKKMISVVSKLSGIPCNIKVNQISKEMRINLISVLKDFKLTIKSFRPLDEAIITSGGINVNEINPKTMESKLIKNLYFCGEIIDVDAYTGGFNLQIAFSTGYLAGKYA